MDDGRDPDGLCEACYSPFHGLEDCPDLYTPESCTRLRFKKAEQIRGCRYTTPGERRHAKRTARRARRRAERQDPENAPTCRRGYTWGWTD